jgi:hypothetical protein
MIQVKSVDAHGWVLEKEHALYERSLPSNCCGMKKYRKNHEYVLEEINVRAEELR